MPSESAFPLCCEDLRRFNSQLLAWLGRNLPVASGRSMTLTMHSSRRRYSRSRSWKCATIVDDRFGDGAFFAETGKALPTMLH